MDELGQITQVYDLGQYELHHDYVFDDAGNILILASDTGQDSVEDIILRLDTEDGTVEEVLDLEDLQRTVMASWTGCILIPFSGWVRKKSF